MRHKFSFLLPALLALSVNMQGQQVQWITADPIAYENNPPEAVHLVCATDADHLYVARSTTLSYLSGTVYGKAVLEQRNSFGEVAWSFALGDSVVMQAMASDANGKVIIGGRFYRALHLGAAAVLPIVHGTTYSETFLFALDSDGNLLWQRNITPNDLGGTDVESITFDPQGRAWYATCNFSNAEIRRLDDAGNDVETRPVLHAKTIGSISFDPQGGLYVSGSATAPSVTVNGTWYPIVPEYNFFVARMGLDGRSQWLRSAEDITFQKPRVRADGFGHAYLLGSPFDTLTFGGIHFHGPEWNSTFFLARLDSLGNFEWGYQPPLGTPFAGQFEVGQNDLLGVDGHGNAVLLGITHGVVAWGNFVFSDIGTNEERAVTLLQVDSTGTPQWELHANSRNYDQVQGLSVLPGGICHIIVKVRDPFELGAYTADVSSATLVLANIAPSTANGMDENSTNVPTIIAYPSPFTSVFRLSADEFSSSAVEVLLRDGTGRIVSRADRLEGLGGDLAVGNYFVEVRQSDKQWRSRVVKQ